MTTPNQPTLELPKIISVDDHVVEPAHLWQTWLPAGYRDEGPRIERRSIKTLGTSSGAGWDWVIDDDGEPGDGWVFDGKFFPLRRDIASVGFEPDERTVAPITYDEMRPGCYDPEARIGDMRLNHVDGSLSFPTFPRFCGQTFAEGSDKELGLACIRAYNDWMVEEWCGSSNGQLIPLCLIPLWDPELAAQEVRRNAKRGCRAVAFSEIPYHLGLPSIHGSYWDPFFRACAETSTVVNMHIGSSSRMPVTSPDAPVAVGATITFNNAMASMADFVFSGLLERYPTLTLAYSEGQIGWIPYVLERADDVWLNHRARAGVSLPNPPSFYFRRQIYGCFFRDFHGIRSLEEIGPENVTFETDYPHTDTTWPNTKAVATELMADLSDEAKYLICRGNAIRMLNL